MNNKGVSAIITASFMILITIIVATFLYTKILPKIPQAIETDYTDFDLEIILQGYTVYDSEKGFAFVHIRRGEDSHNLERLDIFFTFEGEEMHKPYRINEKESLPMSKERKTYAFNLTKDGFVDSPEKVKVVPVIEKNGKNIILSEFPQVTIPNQKIELSQNEWELVNSKIISYNQTK